MANKSLWREFGGWIKSNREQNNLSQDGLGDLAELDRQQIYRIENGKSGTKRETVIKLAKALRLDENEALARAGFGTGVAYSESELLQSIRNELRGSEHWTQSQREDLLRLIKLTIRGIRSELEEKRKEQVVTTGAKMDLKAEMIKNLEEEFGGTHPDDADSSNTKAA